MEFYIFREKACGTMIYGNMPMMIFILAAGYLFTVYLLLALAKRSGQKPDSENFLLTSDEQHQQEVLATPQVTEVVNSQESIVT